MPVATIQSSKQGRGKAAGGTAKPANVGGGGGGGGTRKAASAEAAAAGRGLGEGRIDDYYVVDWGKVLGRGHYATVHRGQNLKTRRVVAVKKIQTARTREESLKAEINVLRAVGHHDNIVTLLDVFVTSTDVLLVMEMCSGGELFDRLVRDGPYSEKSASYHIGCVAGALKYVHSKGIVHRDLKPENLILSDPSPDATLKIADFGLSKVLDRTQGQVQMGTVCGTWAYCAPEVKTSIYGGKAHYTAAVDMWSVGVILFVMMAAYHPFDPEGELSDDQLWRNILSGVFDFNDPVWRNISQGAKDLIRKLIVIDAQKRFTPQQVLEHPWIAQNWTNGKYPEVPDTPISPVINQKLGKYYSRKFKAAGKAVMAVSAFRKSVTQTTAAGGNQMDTSV